MPAMFQLVLVICRGEAVYISPPYPVKEELWRRLDSPSVD